MSVAGVVSSKSACARRSYAAAGRRRWCHHRHAAVRAARSGVFPRGRGNSPARGLGEISLPDEFIEFQLNQDILAESDIGIFLPYEPLRFFIQVC